MAVERTDMAAVATMYRTTIGKKAVMAITGLIGYGFVLLHMYGNLHAFEGPAAFNEYSHFLRTVGMPVLPYGGALWIIRIVLLVALVLHVWSAISLSRADLASRPVRYAEKKALRGNFANMTLRWGGAALFFFILFHLADLTLGWANPSFIEGDAYHNMTASFQNPLVVLVYIIAVACLGMHLFHGVWSAFQTLGLNNKRWDRIWRWLAILSGIGLFLGFAIVPLSVLFGILPQG